MNQQQHILGAVSAADFLKDHWQQEPLLVRAAIPDPVAPLSPNELAGLALDEDVESRIVTEHGTTGPWEVRHGPFTDRDFAALPDEGWTLLVQAVDLWVPEVKALLGYFDFLPPWRLDDIMVSYAAPGGSVGPHFDQYDVFLLQVEGQRRWQIGDAGTRETALVAGTDLSIIDGFEARESWVLDPGDMLYLPPGISHWGVALDACLTYSIGFRSPTLVDMLGDLATELAARGDDRHYRDPPLTPDMASEVIDPAFIEQARRGLLDLLNDNTLLEDWFARYMTASKYPDLEDDTGEERRARAGGRTYRNGDREA